MAKENGRPVDVLEDEEDAYPETGWSDDEDKFLQPCFRLVRVCTYNLTLPALSLIDVIHLLDDSKFGKFMFQGSDPEW